MTTSDHSVGVSRDAWGDLFSRLVAYALPLTYFLVTVSFYLRTYDSAQIKITFTQIGCSLVALFWVLQLICQKRWPFERKDLVLVAPFLASLVSGVVSYLQSSFPAGSLDEFQRRVFYVLMALVVIAEFRGQDRQRRLFRWLLASFAVTVFYGFVQYFDGRLFPPGAGGVGLDPFVWRQAFGWRVFSSFGNPNFYGNFLVIITPVLLAFYYKNGGRPFRPFLLVALLVPVVVLTDKWLLNSFGGVDVSNRWWVVLVLTAVLVGAAVLVWWRSSSAAASGMLIFFGATFVNLYATETKGAWIGFIGALVGMAVLVGLFLLGKKARRATLGLIASALVVALLGGLVVRRYALQRKQSVDFRVFTWIATWDMIRTQPFLGTGIGAFKWAYPAFRRPEIILLEGRSNTETDHAEDEYLEVLFDEGGLGFGIFLWLIVTVSVLGFRSLNRLTEESRGPPFEERVYKIMAYLGAWWGALIHWFMDVSVRFVSSGIYSFLLPGLVVSLVKQNEFLPRQDAPSPWDRRLRLGLVFFWALAFLHWTLAVPGLRAKPGAHLLGSLVAFGLLAVLSELLEIRLVSSTESKTLPPASPGVNPMGPWRWGAVLSAFVVWGGLYHEFRNLFLADVNHNMGIFFSKQGVWTKSPEFDERVKSLGLRPDMAREYEAGGGALDHYERVGQLNPNFPMAGYFIGNVYNDWGSGLLEKANQLSSQGDAAGAQTLRARAVECWDKSLKAYEKVKDFAPNYVQTHHQVGLVFLKKGELERSQGRMEESNRYWDLALKNFALYHRLDPVFPPNYYRMSYIYFQRGELEKAETAYLDALKYNTSNVVGRYYPDRNAETYANLGRSYYIRWVNRFPTAKVLPADAEEFKKAEDYYSKAIAEAEKTSLVEKSGLEPAKGLAVLYARAGLRDKSTALWLKARAWAPDDPDVRHVFQTPPPAR